ncbi:hypothetical protein KBTX_02891 [wastewater metagenome]|uniref:DUF484 family protein n=2 Tax=unclassified sequences TaxID=12908 RepID=A0A5B8RD85_9ZZZZ|nr:MULTISPECIES: DUF484 family protein [Arhodomonas]MCS4505370.1 DUF484 family protein [Arhodomonas aquaeolei]QEA06551.1 hypothetical protein KBTEX_02891 [uncultured organism]
MNEYAENEPAVDEAEEARIAGYLADHPGFFTRHKGLLVTLHIPHDVAPAISLLEYQVRVLRDDERRLRRRLDQLLRIARDNDRLSGQLHRLTLELLDAGSGEAAVNALQGVLQSDFRADRVEVTLIGNALGHVHARHTGREDSLARRLRELFLGHQPVVGRLSGDQMQAAFGEGAEGLRSAAVIPLDDGPVQGIVAIGSRDPERYHGELGTVFLQRLGEVVARQLRRDATDHDG